MKSDIFLEMSETCQFVVNWISPGNSCKGHWLTFSRSLTNSMEPDKTTSDHGLHRLHLLCTPIGVDNIRFCSDTEVIHLLTTLQHWPCARCLQIKARTRYSIYIYIRCSPFACTFFDTPRFCRYSKKLPLQHFIIVYGIYINFDNIIS